MGGLGSTRWNLHSKKNTVEDCHVLSVFNLRREDVIESETRKFGHWMWSNAVTGERKAEIGFEINTIEEASYFRVYYTTTSWSGEKNELDYQILLDRTACHYGGVRWWFICPLSVNGRFCGRRVGKLYFAPKGLYFGCRHCYDLTYKSSQENDKRVNALKRLSSMDILQGIHSGDIDLMIGLKALPGDIWK